MVNYKESHYTMASIKLNVLYISSRKRKTILAMTLLVLAGIVGYQAWNYYIQADHFQTESFKKQRYVLLNLTNFYYLYNPKSICSQRFKNHQHSHNIIGVVHSSRENFISRAIIRRTHGSVTAYRDWHIQVVFVLGMSPPTEEEMIEDLVQREAQKYGDMIVGNFVDTYKNLSYKHVLGYRWAIEFCEGANYYLKFDDDVISNIFFVINFLESEGANKTEKYDKDKDYYCDRFTKAKPDRGKDDPWFVPIEEYPKEYYPDYCGYASYFVSMRTIRKIAALSSEKDVGFLWVDDAFVTGELRQKANEREKDSTKLIKIRNGVSYYEDKLNLTNNAMVLKNILGIVEEERTPRISCGVWDTYLEIYEVSNIYVTKCHELL